MGGRGGTEVVQKIVGYLPVKWVENLNLSGKKGLPLGVGGEGCKDEWGVSKQIPFI